MASAGQAAAAEPGAGLALKLLHLEAEAASMRASAAETQAALDKATARAAALEDVLEETESETVTLKARADAAVDAARDAKQQLASIEADLQHALSLKAAAEDAASTAIERLERRKADGEGEVASSQAAAENSRSAADKLREECKTQIDAASEAVSKIESELAAAQAGERGASARADKLTEELAAACRAKADLEQQIGDLSATLASTKEDVDARALQISELESAVEVVTTERNDGCAMLAALSGASGQRVRQLREMEHERDGFADELAKLTQEAREAIEQAQQDAANEMSHLLVTIEDLNAALEESKSRHASRLREAEGRGAGILEELQSAKAVHDEVVGQLRARIAELTRTSEQVSAAKDDADAAAQRLMDQVARLEASISSLGTSHESAVEERHTLTARVGELEATNAELCSKIEESGELMARVATEGAQMSEKTNSAIADATSKLGEAERRAEESEAAQGLALTAVQALCAQFDKALGVHSGSAPSSLDDALKHVGSALIKLDDQASVNGALSSANAELRAKAAHWEAASTDLEALCKKLRMDNSSLAEDAEKRLQTSHSLVAEAERLSGEHESQRERILELTAMLEEQEQTGAAQLARQAAESARTLDEQERATAITLSSLRATQAQLEADVDDKTNEFEDMKVRLDEAARALGETLADKDAAENKASDKDAELAQLQEQLEMQAAEAQESVDRLQLQIESMEAVRTAESKTSNQLIEDAVAEAEILQDRLVGVEAELAAVRGDVAGAREERRGMLSELDEVRTQIAASRQTTKELAGKLSDAQDARQTAEAQFDEAEKLLAESEAEVARVTTAMGDLQQKVCGDVSEEVKRVREVMEKLAAEHATALEAREEKHAGVVEGMREAAKRSLTQWKAERDELLGQVETVGSRAADDAAQLTALQESTAEQAKRLEAQRDTAVAAAEKIAADRDGQSEQLAELRSASDKLSSELSDVASKLASAARSRAALEEQFAMSSQAISKLEAQLHASHELARAAGDEHESKIAALAALLDSGAAREAESAQDFSKLRAERDAARSKLDHIQTHVLKGKESEASTMRADIGRLERELEGRSVTIAHLQQSIDELKRARLDEAGAGERLDVARAAIAAKDLEIAKLGRAAQESADETAQVRANLREREDASSDSQARVMSLEAEIETQRDIIRAAEVKLASRAEALAQAEASVCEITARCNALEVRESGAAVPGPGRGERDGGRAEQLYEALDKYDAVLEKNSRLRKRSKRFEALLALERKKSAELAATVNSAGAAPQGEADLKRQISPSTKGLSPSVKRAREALYRTPLSPIPSNGRPPLAPRARH
jgi:chromosome segregation ATPase